MRPAGKPHRYPRAGVTRTFQPWQSNMGCSSFKTVRSDLVDTLGVTSLKHALRPRAYFIDQSNGSESV
jgi:hypothetical protein